MHSHLLIEGDEVTLIDGGFLGGVARIEKQLKRAGLGWDRVRHLLLTHGHLDHTFNVAKIQALSRCGVWAPRQDRVHIEGRHLYRGISRLCGALEWIGRKTLRHRAPEIDHWFEPGDELPCWGGLRVIGLPGHTLGHCGFYSASERLLFCGDLFSSYWGVVKLPPPWFNVDGRLARLSVGQALELDLAGVSPNHCRPTTEAEHLADLRWLAARSQSKP